MHTRRALDFVAFFSAAILTVSFLNTAAIAATLDEVKARGSLTCGVNQGLQGFASQEEGKWRGFDVDFCRAVAAAVLGDADKVTYVPLSADDRFPALRDGKIDLLSRNSTWTLDRELRFGLTFAGVSYHDGQGFMLPRSADILSSLDLTGQKVCVLDGTTSKDNIPDYFVANNMTYEIVAAKTSDEAIAAYEKGECGVMTSDMSQLYAWRLRLAQPDEHIILPDAISKEPLGPVVRQDDVAWARVVKWVLFALINAEELGITSERVDEALASDKPAVKRFVGKDSELGASLGLADDWTVQVISKVGHYGEIFERNLGTDSPLGIARGMNQLWSRGGILYAPPLQ